MHLPGATPDFGFRAAIVFSALFLITACGGRANDAKTVLPAGSLSATQSPDGNWFVNPGFEDGTEPWFALHPEQDVGFKISQDFAHAGSYSALLRMRDPTEATGTKVYYLVQEIAPGELPEVVRGYYRVENWLKSTPRQYLQFVVAAIMPANFTGRNNYQIRYLLAGTDSIPLFLDNAYFVFVNRNNPVGGEWIPFEARIREDFQRLWGKVPQDSLFLRLFFEVRWDEKTAGEGPAEADVYFDDLYIGPSQ